jgi:hypothetical protein
MKLTRTTTETRQCVKYDGTLESIRAIVEIVRHSGYIVQLDPGSADIYIGKSGYSGNCCTVGHFVWETKRGDGTRGVMWGKESQMLAGGWELNDDTMPSRELDVPDE